MERTSRRRPPQLTVIFFLVLVNIFWGISFPLTKTISLVIDQHFGVGLNEGSTLLRVSAACWLILLRFTVAFAIFSLCFRPLVRRARAAEWRAGCQIGTLFFIGLIFQITALATIPASRSGFLTSLVAVFTPLLTALVLRIQPRPQVLLGVAVALLGVSVLTGLVLWTGSGIGFADDAWQAWTVGDSLTTIGAVFFAGQLILVDYYGKRLDAAALTPGMFASTAVLAAITFVSLRPLTPESSSGSWLALTAEPRFWSLILVLSVVSSVLAFGLMNSYQHYVSASQAGVIYTLEPVVAASAAMILPGLLSARVGVHYPNEQMVMPMLLGGGLIVLANLISLWPRSPATQPIVR